jgi:cysteine sulfinate desulfinase/cysteine desulfurase-like protein
MDMTPHFPIYLDYGATTPVDPRVVDAMIPGCASISATRVAQPRLGLGGRRSRREGARRWPT